MKKVRFPIVWILLLAAICALTAALAKNIKWVRQEFPMDGSNVSQLDSAQIAGKIAKTQKLKNSEALYVNADNFELRLTKNFDFENRGTIRFFYYDKWDVYSAAAADSPRQREIFRDRARRVGGAAERLSADRLSGCAEISAAGGNRGAISGRAGLSCDADGGRHAGGLRRRSDLRQRRRRRN